MKVIQSLSDVFSFNLNSELIILKNEDIINLKLEKLKTLSKARVSVFINNDNIFILNNRSLAFRFSDLGIFDDNLKLIGYSDSYLQMYDMSDSTKHIYSLTKKSYVYTSNKNLGQFIQDNFLVSGFNGEITLFSLRHLKFLSSFPLSTLGTWKQGVMDYNYEVASFVGIFEDTLVCTLNEGTILYLDINSGDIAGKSSRAMCRTYMHQNNIATNLFYGLSTYRFTAIDVNQKDNNGGVIQTVNLEPALEKIKRNDNSTTSATEINCSEITANNKLIFLTMNDVLGVFNPETAEIEDYHFLDFENKGEMATAKRESLQTKDNKIYVLGSKGTLLELESEFL